jgi:hypothetical protein
LWNGVLIASGKMLHKLLPISSSGLLKSSSFDLQKYIPLFVYRNKASDMFSKEVVSC